MARKISIDIITILFIILWVYAAFNKLLEYQTFKIQLSKSPYVYPLAGILSWALPIGEILIAIALVSKKTSLIGFYASFFMMFLFTGYIFAMLHYSFYVPCSCGGILSKMSWTQHFYFNIFFTLLSFLGIVLIVKSQTKSRYLNELNGSSK